MAAPGVVKLAVVVQQLLDVLKCRRLACIEKLGHGLMRAFIFALGLRAKTCNGPDTLGGEPALGIGQTAPVIGGKSFTVIGQKFLRATIRFYCCGQGSASIESVFFGGEGLRERESRRYF